MSETPRWVAAWSKATGEEVFIGCDDHNGSWPCKYINPDCKPAWWYLNDRGLSREVPARGSNDWIADIVRAMIEQCRAEGDVLIIGECDQHTALHYIVRGRCGPDLETAIENAVPRERHSA